METNLYSRKMCIRDRLGPVKQYEDANNISLVVMMTYGQTKYLFTGDQEVEAEKDLLSLSLIHI